jgi:hypothetical protein
MHDAPQSDLLLIFFEHINLQLELTQLSKRKVIVKGGFFEVFKN